MGVDRPVVLKLGGSAITFKEKPLTPNMEAIEGLGRALAHIDIPLIIVHGGGSYGHYYAQRYGLTTEPHPAPAEGVSLTRAAMQELNLLLIKAFSKYGFNTYSLPPSDLFELSDRACLKRYLLSHLWRCHLTPITYGYVLPCEQGFYVLSGDIIVKMLAEALSPLRVVFAMNTDGILKRRDSPSTLIRTLPVDRRVEAEVSKRLVDVTGGLEAKLQVSFSIAELGVDVFFVNGLKPYRVVQALKGKRVKGTLVRGVRSGRV